MNNQDDHVELVKKAQLGDKESLNRLAEVVRVRLYDFVLRLTLQEDLTQDIVQESILEMYKVFEKLKNTERFWSWLYGIAYNKVRSRRGRQMRHKTVPLSRVGQEVPSKDTQGPLAELVSKELKQIVLIAMEKLEPRQRDVLTMRCYNQMPYSDIAKLMGCTELGVQALFYRAKKSLAKKLSRHGLGKGYLLPALVLFGKMTATSEAAAANVSVTTATVKVGLAASLIATATSKTAVIPLATAGVITVGTVAITAGPKEAGITPRGSQTNNLLATPRQGVVHKGTEECWYFFPEGAGGPAMMRLMKYDGPGKEPYCQRLQNQYANYYYNKKAVQTNNFRIYNPDFSVRRLPTDSERISRFISRVEGRPGDMEYTSNRGKGLLIICKRNGGENKRIWRIARHANVLEEVFFQFDWPESTRIVDNRDVMHRRGWTYFRITGSLNGQKVSGAGRMPFVYDVSKRHYPWLRLQVGDHLSIVDNGAEARISRGSDRLTTRYEGGGFFAGLGRPWMGLHTIDAVRRSAAQAQVWFETRRASDPAKIEVVLTYEHVKLLYTIDMEKDVIDEITFLTRDNPQGKLIFSYMQELEKDIGEFSTPRRESSGGSRQSPPGALWLIKLAGNFQQSY